MHARAISEGWHRESHWLSRFFVLAAVVVTALAAALLPVEWFALLIAATILVTLVLIRPRWALYLLPFAVPFGSIREISLGPATVGGTEALLALFLGAWIARGIARRELHLRRPPLAGAIALWYGVMLFSTWNSLSLAASLKELIKWGETFALYAIAAQELRRRDVAILVVTSLLAGSLAALEGIYQAVFQVGPAGFLFPMGGRLWLRAYGRFIQPNPFAGYMGLTLPLAYGVLGVMGGLSGRTLVSHGTRVTSRMTRAMGSGNGALWRLASRGGIIALAGGSAALIGLALFLSLSRGGWIGAALALVVVGAVLSRRAAAASLSLAVLAVLFLAAGGAQLLPEALATRATDFLPYINVFNVNVRGVAISSENFAVIERLAHWQAAYEMWGASPWLGQGVGNYAAVYPAYRVPPWDDPLGHAHNLFLNTLAETGLIGLVAYLIFWGSAIVLAVRAVRASEGIWQGIAAGVLGAFVHLHAHNFFDNLYVHGMYLHLALLLAMVAVLSRNGQAAEEIQ